MTVYLVARGRIADQAMHDEYVAKAVPTIPASARIIAIDMESEVVEGDQSDHRTVIIEFENREAFRAWYDSPAYRRCCRCGSNRSPAPWRSSTASSPRPANQAIRGNRAWQSPVQGEPTWRSGTRPDSRVGARRKRFDELGWLLKPRHRRITGSV